MTEAVADPSKTVFAISTCIFLHRDGEILILKRADGIESGGWFAPGGHVEYGESPPETACRETLEEIGIRIAPETLRLLETYTIFPGEGLHHLGIVYLAPFPGGDVTLNEEHTGFRWVTPGGLTAVVLWIVASAAFALYVSNFSSYNKTYGSLGGVIAFLVWLWITNIVILFGAELNAELERRRQIEAGMRPTDKEPFLPPRSDPDPEDEKGGPHAGS